MGADKRLSRGERSGRYGSDGRSDDPEWHERRRSRDVERDYDHRRGDDRHKERRDRDSPERGRKRRNSDRSDDEYDGDYPDHHYKMEPEEESKTIMLRGLPLNVIEDDIRSALEQLEGPQPVEIRLMRKRRGISRGFAFVEFYRLQDSTRWMETNQNKLMIQGKSIALHYSNRRQSVENWLCTACGVYNFRKKLKCFRCGAAKVGESLQQNKPYFYFLLYILCSLILRNIPPLSTVDGILNTLASYANLSAGNIRLIKDKHTGQNRGFAFVQLSSPLEASQLLAALQRLQPPLKLDGKTIGVDYAKSARKDSAQPDGIRANALSVASTAIAAAQWSSSQVSGFHLSPTSDYITLPEGYTQQTQVMSALHHWQHQRLPMLQLLRVLPRLLTQQVKLVNYRMSRSAVDQFNVATCFVSYAPLFVAVVAPDTSTYQYDEASGYYYDPQTGLYYDPSSQYYYNSESQQYLYWDSEKQMYIPALAESDTSTEQVAKEPREKKEKPKSKSAQQIAKDMERWAKSFNKQKESFKSSSQGSGPSKEEDRRESAAADAGFALFEKKVRLMTVCLGLWTGPVAAFNEDGDAEEGGSDRAACEDGKITDWRKMVCLLCRRQFPTKEALLRHQQLSDLHKQNLEIQRRSKLTEAELEELERKETELKYRDRAAERREKYGVPEPPAPKKRFYPPPTPAVNYEQPTKDGLTSDNIGSKMLQAMGWQEGKGLGRHHQGITAPITASLRTKGTGLGIKGSSYELSASDTYKDAVRKAMFSRFTEIE
uniref:RNA binding motif protein 5 n=1 Tax=Sparus aurata TaxID=8175 RepID=A0A671VWP4_SPAAU